MKKLFFTAVALVAFSGASFAGEKLKNEKFKKRTKTVKIMSPGVLACAARATRQMDGLEPAEGPCMSPEDYTAAWNNLYNECMAC